MTTARSHSLSLYTPACTQCGLPLCTLNAPFHSCPSCRSPLLSPPAVTAVLASVTTALAAVLQKEDEQRRQLEAERRRVEGGFPVLGAATATSSNPADAPQQTHKVLSLKANRITVSRPRATPPASRSVSRAVTPEDWDAGLAPRVPAPPAKDVQAVRVRVQVAQSRPWYNAREDIAYVEPARVSCPVRFELVPGSNALPPPHPGAACAVLSCGCDIELNDKLR